MRPRGAQHHWRRGADPQRRRVAFPGTSMERSTETPGAVPPKARLSNFFQPLAAFSRIYSAARSFVAGMVPRQFLWKESLFRIGTV